MTVFANKLEVSCKAQANKIIAAFPDVCMTPPEAPPTPPGIPIPYPNFGMDSDTDKGTGTVKIGGQTVNQKNKSYFTKTTGDEAGAAAKKGVISSKNTGKSYSQAFSMNVKAEGENLCRFSDISTNNHGSPPNAPPWPKIGLPNPPSTGDPCADNDAAIGKACGNNSKDEVCSATGLNTGPASSVAGAGSGNPNVRHGPGLGSDYWYTSDYSAGPTWIGSGSGADETQFRDKRKFMDEWDAAQANDCLAASRCRLEPYNHGNSCCPGQTGHHLVDAACFNEKGRGVPGEPQVADITEGKFYNPNTAPVICAEGPSATKGSHGALHTEMKAKIVAEMGGASATTAQKEKWVAIPMKTVTENADGSLNVKNTTTAKTRSLTYQQFRDGAVDSVKVIFPKSGCNPECLKAQLDAYHKDKLGVKETTPLRAELTGKGDEQRAVAMEFNRSRQRVMEAQLAARIAAATGST